MNVLQSARMLMAEGNTHEAMALLTSAIDKGRDCDPVELAAFYYERGKLHWRMGEWGAASADWVRASALDADSPASLALQQARDVAGFFNKDLYNP